MANPVGEDAWLAYIQETTRTASDLEQRVNVVELYKRAVGDEPGSMRLWLAYCTYFWHLWESSNSNDAGWSEEEQMLGREVFSFGAALDLWQQGYEAIKYRLSDSHELWDLWISFEKEQFVKSKTPEGLRRITHLYRQRLATPHLNWEETAQKFSGFLSEYNQSEWEKSMQEITANAQATKKAIQARDPFEFQLKQAHRNGDVEAQKAKLREYLDWEVRGTKRRQDGAEINRNICAGLFDRALTGLFATDEDAWHDYIVFLSSSTSDFQSAADHLLDASRRSVLHCPWSGRLWSRYILCAEEANLAFADIESIKHTATSNNQLYKNGMESMIEMYGAWCAFLKRTALEPAASDEAADVAEVGLRAAIEDVEVTGKRLYGKEFQGDPKYRLERLYIQYLTEKKGAIEEARVQWKKLEHRSVHADSYDFWFNYYIWEMLAFSKQNHGEDVSPHGGLHVPTIATAVLYSAATRKTIDWPERVLEMYQQHCNNYELPTSVRQADDFVNKTQKILAYRRKKQEEQQAAQYAAYYESQAQAQTQAQGEGFEANEQSVSTADASSSPSGPKRKRESLTDLKDDAENASKRQRNGDEISEIDGQTPKRDREHSTIIVTHLPADATQTAVRKYFKPYGHINNLTAFIKEEDGQSTTALIEFGSAEEAQSALLRDAKYFGESQITVQPGHDLTVYVANFPPAADDQFIRDLFKDCGDILSIRWPSLKVNTHRRFCYVSFRDRDASAKAVAKEGKLLEGKYRLLAKYSDPSRKKNREGAIAERREVHISNLDLSTTEAEIRSVFSQFGTVKRVNIPLNMAGKNRGFAFLDFESKDQAEKAVAELNNTKFKSQILKVELSKESKVKPSAKTEFQHASASPAPSSLNDAEGDQAMGDAVAEGPSKPSSSEIAARTIALMGLPDTVNDARVKALVEPLGSIVKLVHQPGHGGAIIEFADAAAAGKAALQLDSMEYEGHTLRTGSPDELRQNKPGNKPVQQSRPKGLMAPPQATRRPVGRPGPKRGLGFAPRPATATATASEPMEKEGGPKSNADFKAMFLAGKKENEG
ncbi:Splicing factor [Metarhizium acridum]|uniref:Splicing factor n=1 Tax=Metarhizium acridum TaxID=92637 RepID=UPI001C6D1089|nr:Splicing factor [Metarhizium acridum]